MAVAASSQAAFEAGVGAAAPLHVSRAAFEAFYARWLPRVYRYAARRVRSRADAEAVTRAVLEAAVGGGLVGADDAAALRLLALAKAELARRRGAPA